MTYRFKPLPELYWGVVIAMATVLLTDLVGLTTDTLADWRPWVAGLVVACVRAGAGAAIDYIRRSMMADEPAPTLADEILALSDADLAILRAELEHRRKLPPEIRRTMNTTGGV